MTVCICLSAHTSQCRSSKYSFVKVCFPKCSIRESSWLLLGGFSECWSPCQGPCGGSSSSGHPPRTRRAAGQGSAISKGNKVALPQAAPQGFQLQNGNCFHNRMKNREEEPWERDESKIHPQGQHNLFCWSDGGDEPFFRCLKGGLDHKMASRWDLFYTRPAAHGVHDSL